MLLALSESGPSGNHLVVLYVPARLLRARPSDHRSTSRARPPCHRRHPGPAGVPFAVGHRGGGRPLPAAAGWAAGGGAGAPLAPAVTMPRWRGCRLAIDRCNCRTAPGSAGVASRRCVRPGRDYSPSVALGAALSLSEGRGSAADRVRKLPDRVGLNPEHANRFCTRSRAASASASASPAPWPSIPQLAPTAFEAEHVVPPGRRGSNRQRLRHRRGRVVTGPQHGLMVGTSTGARESG